MSSPAPLRFRNRPFVGAAVSRPNPGPLRGAVNYGATDAALPYVGAASSTSTAASPASGAFTPAPPRRPPSPAAMWSPCASSAATIWPRRSPAPSRLPSKESETRCLPRVGGDSVFFYPGCVGNYRSLARGLDFCCTSSSSTRMALETIKPLGVSRQRPLSVFFARSRWA